MGLIPNPLSSVLEGILAYQDRRHDVISGNIANANTPGYRAFDLVLKGSMDQMQPLEARRSQAGHLSMDERLDRLGARVMRSEAPGRLDGNNVSMEQEFVKLMENRMRYNAAFELMDRWGSLMPLARETR